MYKRILLGLIFIISVATLATTIRIFSLNMKHYKITKSLKNSESNSDTFVKRFTLSNNGIPIELVETIYGFGIFVSDKDETVSRHIKNTGFWEPDMVTALRHFVKSGDVIVHLGTHIGFHDIILGEIVGPEGHVYAFEPNPESYDIVKKNLVINNLDNRFTLYPLGVTDASEDGQKAHICFDYANTGGAFVVKDTIKEKAKCSDITLTSLDKTLSNIPTIDVLFMDVEGFELKAINGAEALLKRSPNAIIILEWTPDFLKRAGSLDAKEFVQSYLKDGYRFFNIADTSIAQYTELSEAELFPNTPLYQTNIIIVPRSFTITPELSKYFIFKTPPILKRNELL